MRISIDLWGTLIKSSPLFHTKKTELTAQYFSCTEMISNYNFKVIKNTLNLIIERTGWMPEKQLIIKLLDSYFNPSGKDWLKTFEFYNAYQKLAIEYPPLLYNDETKEFLKKLSEEHTLILSSNTMLLEATTLCKILQNLKIFEYFEELNFSSNLKVSKPDKKMYSNSNFHIGDNFLTDRLGASNAKSFPIIINSNDLTIKNAYNIISEKCKQLV